jgi:hypothetical protein
MLRFLSAEPLTRPRDPGLEGALGVGLNRGFYLALPKEAISIERLESCRQLVAGCTRNVKSTFLIKKDVSTK